MEEIKQVKRGRPPKKQIEQSKLVENIIVNTENKLTPKKQELYEYYESVKNEALYQLNINFQSDLQYECQMCHKLRPHNDFFRSYSYKDMGSLNETGERHLNICKKCSKNIFNFYYKKEQNLFNALNHWCQTMDIYFSKEIYDAMIVLHNSRKGTEMESKFDYLTDYITALGRARIIGLTYWDSPYLQNTDIMQINVPEEYYKDEDNNYNEYPDEFEGWSQDDLQNYDYVLEVYHYDPFKDEELEDRRKLYYNLAGLSSEDILDDFAKANAAIDTCRSMVRLEKLNKLRIDIEKSGDVNVKELKCITDLQQTERKNIALQGKEHGFTKKYNLSKGQGSGTFTGIIKQMDENMFEDALVNAYDIKTSNAMQMAAEASWKAIFGQLNISESEFAQIVANQRETIVELRQTVDKLKEDLRLANIKIKKRELEDKLAEEESK